MSYASGRHLFSYESKHQTELKKWSLFVSVPLRGEEDLILDYSLVRQGKVNFSGSFARQIMQTSSRRDVQFFQLMIKALGEFLDLKQSLIENKGKGVCTLSLVDQGHWKSVCGANGEEINVYSNEKGLELSQIRKGLKIRTLFSRFSDDLGKFALLEIAVMAGEKVPDGKIKFDDAKQLMQSKFFLSQCQSDTK